MWQQSVAKLADYALQVIHIVPALIVAVCKQLQPSAHAILRIAPISFGAKLFWERKRKSSTCKHPQVRIKETQGALEKMKEH